MGYGWEHYPVATASPNGKSDGLTGTRLLSRRLSLLELVLLVTGVWRAEERETGNKGMQE